MKDNKSKRNIYDIAYMILNVTDSKVKISDVVLKARLNYKIAKDCIDKLCDSGLLEQVSVDGYIYYRRTNIGLRYMNLYNDIINMLNNKQYKPIITR